MTTNRRTFLNLTAGAAAASGLVGTGRLAHGEERKVKAVLFDAFVIFDYRPISALVNELFPGGAGILADLWRTRMFDYAWLRVIGRRYEDFGKIVADSLDFTIRGLELAPNPAAQSRLMDAYLELKPHPDVPAALGRLAEAGIRLGFLSNLTPKMLESSLKAGGLRDRFEHVISTDRARTYKPDPRAYQLGLDVFGVRREEAVFAAAAGWDAAGAKWFGYPTFWVNRGGAAVEGLDAAPDAAGRNMDDLVAFVRS